MPHAPSWQSKLDFAPMRCTRSSTLALALALGVAAQHGARRRRHQEAAATHGVAADDDPRGPPDDHELWLRSSGAVNAEGKGLLRRQEARFVEDWWCAKAGNEETYACRARAARRRIRNETNTTVRHALLRALPHRPTDGPGRKALLEQAAEMRTAYCAKEPDAERKAATLCAAPRLRQLARPNPNPNPNPNPKPNPDPDPDPDRAGPKSFWTLRGR